MTHAQQMVETNPGQAQVDESTLVGYIEACYFPLLQKRSRVVIDLHPEEEQQ